MIILFVFCFQKGISSTLGTFPSLKFALFVWDRFPVYNCITQTQYCDFLDFPEKRATPQQCSVEQSEFLERSIKVRCLPLKLFAFLREIMDESHRKVLQKLRLKIARNINPRQITETLFSRGILDQDDRESVLAQTTTQDKALHLLDLLSRSGPEAFQVFLDALHGSNRAFLVNTIRAELAGEQTGEGNEWKSKSTGLPRKVPKFVGRVDVCTEITSLLMTTEDDDMICLVTLVAPPGFGKTTVATNVGYMMLEHGKDVLYFSLRNMSSFTVAAENFLKEVAGIQAQENPILELTRYLTSLHCPTLLILDNAEDVQIRDESKFEEFLEKIGQHAKNVVTLVTSRNSVSKLDLFYFGTKHIPLRPLFNEDSSTYLKNHVPNISNQHAKDFAIACRGVPLLLKITASFLNKKVNPVDLHKKLQNCPHSFLKTNHVDVRELYSFLKVFYNSLRPEMKEALAYLASFPTTFTLKEAQEVLFPEKDDLEFQLLLSELEDHSLVQRDAEDNIHTYYSLHPLVQAFCKSCRDDICTAYNTAIRHFSNQYLSLLQRLNDDFISTDCKTAIDNYHISKTNISHALLASTEDQDHDLKCRGLSVSTEAVNFLAKVLNMDEFTSLYSQCLKEADKLPDKTLYSECLVSIGFKQLCYYGYKDAFRTEAKEHLQEAHDLQTHLGISDTECIGHCKCKLGLCSFISGDIKKGISLIAQGISVRKKRVRTEGSGKMERMLLAGGYCDLGMAMFTSGKYRAAVNIWRNLCLVRYRELLGTHPFTASLLHYIGDGYQKLGDHRRAVDCKRESLKMRKELLGDEHLDTARAFYGVGCALGALGSTEEALENLNKAREIQVRFLASRQDIDKTEQEINQLRGRTRTESPCRMLQQMYIQNTVVTGHNAVTLVT